MIFKIEIVNALNLSIQGVCDIGFFLATPPLFLRFFRDFATPGAAFFKRGVALEEGGSQKGGPHFFLRGAAF